MPTTHIGRHEYPLAYFYAWARALRFADGPDEVHIRSVARQELKAHRS